ncbi:hypothetical protein OESDEN_21593, partial [Oesophagostomum dentatum]
IGSAEKLASKQGSVSKDASKSKEVKVDKPKAVAVEGKLTGALAFAVFSVTLGSFQFGYHIGCVNAPGQIITDWIVISHKDLFGTTLAKERADFVWSTAVSVFAVGGAIGGISSGVLADKAGRKGGLFWTNVFAFAASVCMGCAKMAGFYPLIIVGRFLIGIYAGNFLKSM